MTDQPKPERQDDGLPKVTQRVQQSGVYGGTRLGTVIKSTSDRFTVKWDTRTVACRYTKEALRSDHHCPISVIELATPPSSNGAEGDNWHADFQTRCRALGAAPPKPAPDAMREALVALLPDPLKWKEDGDGVLTITVRKADLRNARAALSAPVSSPDGAGDLENLRIANYRLYEALEHMEQTVEAQKDWTEKCASRRVIAEDRWREVAMENAQLRAALSPATGAAEPVAYIVLSEELDDFGYEKTRIWWRNKIRADNWCAQHNATAIPLYAAPLVRGDRESAIEILEKRAAGYEARGTSIFNGQIIADELRANIRAIRALPVQPGADKGDELRLKELLNGRDGFHCR